jgi:hypothetical protein
MKQNSITIDLDAAKKLYPLVSSDIRKQLVENFGKEHFGLGPFELKTMDDIYYFLDMTQEQIDEIENTPAEDEKNYRRIKKIVRALNRPNFVPNFDDSTQKKWAPIFSGGESGFGFSGSLCACTYANASLGSLLCFETEELSDYAGKTFTQIYKGFIINKF